MTELERLQESLAQRCIEKDKEPLYIFDIKSITNILNQEIHIEDVRKGDTIHINCTRLPMEDVSRWPGMYDGRIHDSSDIGTIKIKVQDIASAHGHYLIEYAGGMFSTLDFEKAWKVEQEHARAVEATRIVSAAIEDTNHWFRPNIDDFLEYFKVDVSEIDKHNRRSFYVDMMSAVQECIQSKNLRTPFDYSARLDIAEAARHSVYEYKRNGLQKTREELAEKFVQMGKPVIYAVSLHKIDSNDQSVNINWEKLPKNLPIELSGSFIPMTMANGGYSQLIDDAEHLDFPNLTLESVIRTKDDSVYYVTNIGVITTVNMSKEYKQALMEHGQATEMSLAREGRLQKYLSMTSNSRFIHSFDGSTHKQMESINNIAYKIAKNAIVNNKSIVLCTGSSERSAIIGYEPHERDPHSMTAQRTALSNILPGQTIGLAVDSATHIVSGVVDKANNVKVKEIYSNGSDFIIVTDNAIYTTYQSIADAANGIFQSIEVGEMNPITAPVAEPMHGIMDEQFYAKIRNDEGALRKAHNAVMDLLDRATPPTNEQALRALSTLQIFPEYNDENELHFLVEEMRASMKSFCESSHIAIDAMNTMSPSTIIDIRNYGRETLRNIGRDATLDMEQEDQSMDGVEINR